MNEEQLRRQRRFRILVLSCIGIIFFLFSGKVIMDYLDSHHQTNTTYTSETQLPLDGIDPKEIWVDQIRSENEIVQEKVDFIQTMFSQRIKDEGERDFSTKNEINALRNELGNLRDEIKKTQTPPISYERLSEEVKNVSENYQQPLWNPSYSPLPSPFPDEIQMPLTFVTCPEPANLYHVNRTIPSGTTVKAILLSSVDMPCGIKGSTDPLPVKLRIIADANLPHHIRALLKSGIVTACVYGDLSSERVYFRLEKLSQVRKDGHFIETQIAGYVSGEDGKYGLRGTVVDKSALIIENALMSGFLSGVSNFFEAAAMARLNPVALNGYGEVIGNQQSWSQSAGQLGIAGGSQGVTNALDALTDYFIKRAEQLRPVIQITPGRIVDITFSDSADLGDLYTHERVRKSGDV